jgi:hypothetical protein
MKKVKIRVFLLRQKIITLSTTNDWVLLLNVQNEVVSRKSDAILIYVSTNSPFSKIIPGAIPGPILFIHGLKFAESLQFYQSDC